MMRTLSWQLMPISECQEQLWCDWRVLFDKYHSHNPMLDPRFVSCLVDFYPADIYVVTASDNCPKGSFPSFTNDLKKSLKFIK